MGARRDPVLERTIEGKIIFQRNEDGKPICYSKLPGKPGRCRSTILFANGRCKKHGGKSLSGVFHPAAKHLRTAERMPLHLRADMEAAGHDPQRLDVGHEIDLVDVRIAQLKAGIGVSGSKHAWKTALDLADDLEYSLEEDPERSEELCHQLIAVLRNGSSEREAWAEMFDKAIETRRRLVETAHKRERDLKLLLRADQAGMIITAVGAAVHEGITHLFVNIQKRYKLIERDTGKESPRIDAEIRNHFLSFMHQRLGRLINKTRANAPIVQGEGTAETDETVILLNAPPNDFDQPYMSA